MRTIISLCLTAFLVIGMTGCGGESPESLAKQTIEAMKTKDEAKLQSIGEKVKGLSDSDKQKYGEAMAKEMFQGLGDMMKGMGGGGGGFPGGGFKIGE